uniref:Mediator of RNA polymerase II transcription subunit 9 n=1 Tax=Salvator merianae TaxID=96440 RepID=A0A8D0BPU2_SALMN
MATAGAASGPGSRSAADEPPAQPPGGPPGAAPPGPGGEPPLPPPPPPAQPSPAEAKFQVSPSQGAPVAAKAQQPPPAAAPLGEDNYSFLPLVHDIIKCMDKDSQDVHQVLNELRTKFVEMRRVIKTMQGIGVSPEQQQIQLQNLREQVKTKSELLHKYRSLCMLEIPKE